MQKSGNDLSMVDDGGDRESLKNLTAAAGADEPGT